MVALGFIEATLLENDWHTLTHRYLILDFFHSRADDGRTNVHGLRFELDRYSVGKVIFVIHVITDLFLRAIGENRGDNSGM